MLTYPYYFLARPDLTAGYMAAAYGSASQQGPHHTYTQLKKKAPSNN